MIIAADHKKNKLFDRLLLKIYGLYFILFPFYLWRSGLPQIADIVMVMIIVLYLYRTRATLRRPIHLKLITRIAVIFFLHITLINTTWMLLLNTTESFWLPTFFYLYNISVFLITISLYCDYREQLLATILKSIVVSLVVQLSTYLFGGGFAGGRMVLGFNNPNQLGYYSLITAGIILLTSKRIKINIWWFLVGLFASLILCLASLSKASIVSYAFMLGAHIAWTHPDKIFKRRLIALVVILGVSLVLIYTYTDYLANNHLINAVIRRMDSIGKDSDDSLEGRGYDRIWKYPQYWIFGAGEGGYIRFDQNMEFHSTLGNIQVSYGIIGLTVFLALLFLVIKVDEYQSIYIVAAMLLYGLTHNGIRNSMFWILLVLVSVRDSKSAQYLQGEPIGMVKNGD